MPLQINLKFVDTLGLDPLINSAIVEIALQSLLRRFSRLLPLNPPGLAELIKVEKENLYPLSCVKASF